MSTTIPGHDHRPAKEPATVVLQMGGMLRASEKAVVEAVLGRRPGVLAVEANPVSQTANVTVDPASPRWPSCGGGSRTVGSIARASRSRSTSATR
jgi:hypothetical protein